MVATPLPDQARINMTPELCTLVTGASSGIGRETALRLSQHGPLLLHGRDVARLEETRVRCQHPERHHLWPHDLADLAGIERSLVQLLAAQGLQVARFVHCAGVLQVGPLRLLDRGAIERTMNVNFLSAVEITRLLVRKKINEKALNGVVFVSSTASQFGAKGFGIYCASKSALDGYMRALAVELAPAVRVNAVLPGAVRTAMTEHMFEDADVLERMQRDYPLGVGEQADIAAAVNFLLSDEARWVTGQQLVVDGGRTVNITG
ncbi:SDR family oxidoreductase [Herbaspirillum sp. RU 5E]|nr:SDR family oxidoreductase [Herbaspirillum sp. RU 5E]MRT30643.1 SDR family oxidoreductase [Herbaspirillum sp. CAH-3]